MAAIIPAAGRGWPRVRAFTGGFIGAGGLLLGVFAAGGALAPGEPAPADVITPEPLVVVDPVRTAEWRRQERERLPAVWRMDPEAGGKVLNQLAESFAGARTDFVSGLASTFSKPVLDVADLNSPGFRQAVLAFRQRRPEFPLSTELARLWALGASGDVVRDDWMEMLRRAAATPVAAENTHARDRGAGGSILLVRGDSWEAGLNLDLLERSGSTVPASDLWTPARARSDWTRLFPGADATVGPFLAGLLIVNCTPEPETTRRWHERRTATIHAADRYEAGAVLVRKGQIIDDKAARALHEMSSRVRWEQPKPPEPAPVAPAPAPVPTIAPVAARPDAERKREPRWRAMALVAVAGVGAAAILFAVKRRRGRPAKAAPWARGGLLVADGDEESWRGRALAAEHRAERLGAVVKAELAPVLGHQFVQTLVTERSRMVEARRLAEADVAELERRLNALHAPLTERLRAYEERIAELERELAVRDEENRELLQTRMALTREKLAAVARASR